MGLRYIKGASLPEPGVTWRDDDGDVIDFASGWTFVLKIGIPGVVALVRKTSGLTGAATAPNITIDWTATELDDLDAGSYVMQIDASHTATNQERKFQDDFTVTAQILDP